MKAQEKAKAKAKGNKKRQIPLLPDSLAIYIIKHEFLHASCRPKSGVRSKSYSCIDRPKSSHVVLPRKKDARHGKLVTQNPPPDQKKIMHNLRLKPATA